MAAAEADSPSLVEGAMSRGRPLRRWALAAMVTLESVTPAAHAERGSQVALRCDDAGEVMKRLIERGVVGDYRAPDVLRFGFTPLYVGFADVERAARVLARTLAG